MRKYIIIAVVAVVGLVNFSGAVQSGRSLKHNTNYRLYKKPFAKNWIATKKKYFEWD